MLFAGYIAFQGHYHREQKYKAPRDSTTKGNIMRMNDRENPRFKQYLEWLVGVTWADL